MSLALLRDGPLSAKRLDRAASLKRHSSKLRALNAITTTITQQCGLATTLQTDFDAIPTPPLTPGEAHFLQQCDLEKGRYFQDSSLPVSLEAIQAISPFKPTPIVAFADEEKKSNESLINNDVASTAPTAPQDIDEPKITADSVKDALPDGTALDAPLARTESGPIRPSDVVKQHPEHHPKTVHLPPREVQEASLRARRESRDELRAAQLRAAEANPVDPTSSPSSTIGAWSTTTPMPADPSPVTSIGEDAIPSDHLEKQPENSQSAAEDEVIRKPEHHSLLEAQKEMARREILGPDLASPDVQLRLEQEQAVKAKRDTVPAGPPSVAASGTANLAPESATNVSDMPTKESRVADDAIDQAATVPVATDVVMEPQPSQSPASKSTLRESVQPAATPTPDDSVSIANRMATRVSSGTLRQKSVSEITGEAHRSSLSSAKRQSIPEPSPSLLSPTTQIPEMHVPRQQRAPIKPEFLRTASQPKRQSSLAIRHEGYEALRGAASDPAKDYLEPLFQMQTYENLPMNKTLSDLLARASKVVSTADQFAGIHERQDYRILRRVYQLQNANRWSLRHMLPSVEPAAPKTHMDYLLTEMKWMRTDFRQERKLKRKMAKYLAEECAEWVNSDRARRLSLQVVVKVITKIKPTSNAPHSPAETNFENGESQGQDARSPPGLDSSNEQDDSSADDADLPGTPQYVIAPSSIFSAMDMEKGDYDSHINPDNFRNAMSNAIFDLPLYAPFNDDPEPASSVSRQAVPPVSKYCEGRMMAAVPPLIKKRSRYDHDAEDDEDAPPTKRARARDGAGVPPEQVDVALFDSENKLLRDRLHSNTVFRPPSEFPMPSSNFYEFRNPSQWIAEDDQLLRRLAKDYSFNWSLIADEMSLPSTMAGAADRRTPWECFERWVELESLPNEMRKTLYFKTWKERIDTAGGNNEMRYQAQLQQQSQMPNQSQSIVRRRTLPTRVEKRRSSRYLHVVDAMRKNARKREQQLHKQAEAQKAASLRKQHESTAPKSVMHSPAEFSRIRHERDVAYAQRQEQYRQQVMERQRQAAMAQRPGQFPGQQGHPNPNPQRAPNAPQLQPSQPQQNGNTAQMHPNQQAQPPRGNAHLAPPPMGMQGNIPQAPMQANMRGGSAGNTTNHASSDNMQQRMVLEQAHRQAQMKQQQAQMNGQQFQMAPPNRSSPGGVHGVNGQANNQAMVAGMHQNNNQHVSTPNGTSVQQNFNNHSNNATNSASPHMPPPPTPAASASVAAQQQPQQLSSGHVPAITQITHQLQAKHPNASPDQIKELTSQHLKQFYSQQQTQQQNHQARQSAMQAAAGTHTVAPSPGNQAAYSQNQAAFQQNNSNMATNGHSSNHPSTNGNNITNGPHQPNYANSPVNGVNQSPSANVQYSAAMRQQLIQQRQNQIQSAAIQAANGSPRPPQASPSLAHASPNMAQAVPNMNGVANRTPTPQMARMNSSNGQPGQVPLQSPGLSQGSPRAVPAGVAQRQ